jgi:hypothetical protein
MPAAREPHVLDDIGDEANVDELVAMARHEHDAIVLSDIDGEGEPHARQDDDVLERDQPQILLGHVVTAPQPVTFRN